jgi:hypothetical protein
LKKADFVVVFFALVAVADILQVADPVKVYSLAVVDLAYRVVDPVAVDSSLVVALDQ